MLKGFRTITVGDGSRSKLELPPFALFCLIALGNVTPALGCRHVVNPIPLAPSLPH